MFRERILPHVCQQSPRVFLRDLTAITSSQWIFRKNAARINGCRSSGRSQRFDLRMIEHQSLANRLGPSRSARIFPMRETSGNSLHKLTSTESCLRRPRSSFWLSTSLSRVLSYHHSSSVASILGKRAERDRRNEVMKTDERLAGDYFEHFNPRKILLELQ